jgi:hypothetical protein
MALLSVCLCVPLNFDNQLINSVRIAINQAGV